MRKLLTLCAAVLASVSLWAATETQPSSGTSNSAIVGTSYTFDGTYVAGTGSAKAGAMTSKGIKVRLNRTAVSNSGIANALEFTVNEGYAINSITIVGITNSDNKAATVGTIYVDGVEWNGSFDGALPAKNAGVASNIQVSGIEAQSSVVFAFSDLGGASQGNIEWTIEYAEAKSCTDPANPLVLTSDAAETVYEGDKINLSTTGGNGCGIGIAGTADEELGGLVGLTWTATKGEHTFVATQPEYEGYCEQVSELKITVYEKTPVTAATIDGPETGFIGAELTYTATAEGASDYEWYVDGVAANNNSATFVYTAAKGDHVIYCEARNQFNMNVDIETWVKSNEISLSVTKLCGEIIKAVHDGTAKGATVSGVIGGTVDKNTQDGGKLGSNGHYFGIKLAEGNFQAGDVVTVVASGLQGGNTATLFSDKGSNSLGSADFDTETLTAEIILTQSAEWIYLYRVDGKICNPVMGSISVTRSCEDSNDASIYSLTVNGEEVAKDADANVYEYTVSASYEEATVTVAFEIHPLATANVTSPFTINVPNAGDVNGQAITVTAEDGTQVTYTVLVGKSASLNNDATLSDLTVDGYELNPAFDPAVTEYSITKAYGAEAPAVSAFTATPNDANATAEVALNGDIYVITVTAEDGKTVLTYNVSVTTAAAKKDLLEVLFSNQAKGAIEGNMIQVPYLAGKAEPEFVSATFWNADGEPTANIIDGDLVVTGADGEQESYAISYVALVPMDADYNEVIFSDVPSYIFAPYGFDANKGIKIAKDVEESANKRISRGIDRLYIALPKAKSVILTSGSGSDRPITVTVNGVVNEEITKAAKQNETITIPLAESTESLVCIESNGSNGDGGFTKLQLVKGDPILTGAENTADGVQAVKAIRNGQLVIIKNGVEYNAQGTVVK